MPRGLRYLALTGLALVLPYSLWALHTQPEAGTTPAAPPVAEPLLPPLPDRLAFVDGKRSVTLETERLGIDPQTRRLDEAEARERLERLARRVDDPGVNARLQFSSESGGWTVTRSRSARRMNQQAMLAVLRAWAEHPWPKTALSLPMEKVPPRVPTEELLKVKSPMAQFTTHYNPGDRPRTHNLRLVAERLDGAVVMPGEVFSFNNTVGPRTKGFRAAKIYVRGKIKTDLGGGTCQVSSTLYNATLLAGLPIVERTSHSLTVPYVTPGRDATVYYGSLDYKFRNSTDAPIYIRAVPGGARLRITLYGGHPPTNDVEIVSRVRQRNRRVYATVYRVFKHGDQVVQRERLHSNVYGRHQDAARA